MVVKTNGSHFGVGEFTTHFRTDFSGDWDVHWRYGILPHGHIEQKTKWRVSKAYMIEAIPGRKKKLSPEGTLGAGGGNGGGLYFAHQSVVRCRVGRS